MDPCHPYPLNTLISTPNYCGALRLTSGTQYFPNSTPILYRPSQTCRMILVPLLFGISDASIAGTFSPPHFIFVEMPQILQSYHSAKMR